MAWQRMPRQAVWQVFVFKNPEGARSATARSFPNTPRGPKVARRQFDVNYPPERAGPRRSPKAAIQALEAMRNGS